MALTTLNAVKHQAGISLSDTSRDTQLRSFIDGVTSLVKQQLNRDLELSTYTEYYSGNNKPILILRQYPVVSVTRVCVDNGAYFGDASGAFPVANDLVSGVDYALLDGLNGKGGQGILRRIGGTWYGRPYRELGTVENLAPVGNGNILVTYTAGYTTIPAAISMAVNSLVVRLTTQASIGGGAKSMSYEDASVSYLTPADFASVFGAVESTLANYKSIPI